MSQCTSCGGDCRKAGCDRSNAKWKTCAIHGDENPNVWGCPECLRELREENKRLKDALTKEKEIKEAKND